MAKEILKCVKCGKYTLKQIHCGKKTISSKPPKYGPEDKYGRERRKYKRKMENKTVL